METRQAARGLPRARPARQARTAEAVHRLRRRAWERRIGCSRRRTPCAAAASTSCSASSRRTAVPRPRPSSKGSRPCRARASNTAASTVEEMDLDAVLARAPASRGGRRDRPHQRPRIAQQEALPGRARAARRRDQRHLRLQRPASREPQGPRRARHRRGDPRDRAGQLPQAGRPGREPRSRHRGSARAAARRQDLRPDEGRVGAHPFLQGGQPVERCASWRCARSRSGSTCRRGDRQRRRRAARAARLGPRDGLHVVGLAARRDPAAARLAPGRAVSTPIGSSSTSRRPEESPTRIDAEAQRHLIDNIERARELGAEVARLQARDPVPALLDFARTHGVGHIIVGRSHQPWWKRRPRRSTFVHRMRARRRRVRRCTSSPLDRRGGGMTLRTKLLLAQAPLGLALRRCSRTSLAVSYHARSAQRRERSSRTTTAASSPPSAWATTLEALDRAALVYRDRPRRGWPRVGRQHRGASSASSRVQEGNITEAGEREATALLRRRWDDYRGAFAELRSSASPTAPARVLLPRAWRPRFAAVRATHRPHPAI